MYERLQFHNIDIYTQLLPVLDPAIDIYTQLLPVLDPAIDIYTQLLPVLDPAIDIYIHKYYLYLIQL